MGVIRSIIEKLSRGRVLRRNIMVQGVSLPILVSPDAQLKYLKPGLKAFDQDLIEIAENYLKENSNVWDVGANVGVFAFAASTVASKGSVLAIEADDWLIGLLRRSAQFKQYRGRDLSILPVAISRENSVASFLIAKRGRASNALAEAGGRSQMGGVRMKQFVPTLTLDTLLKSFSKPDFVKIDVEGAEYMVLQGANELIEHVRPIFYIEVGQDVAEDVLSLFTSKKYLACNFFGEVLSEGLLSNSFFVPEEKRSDLLPKKWTTAS